VKIVTDGSIDMPADWASQFDIEVIPLKVSFGERIYTQGVDVTTESFYGLVNRLRIIPRSSLPSPQHGIDFYRKIAKKGETVLSIHVASKLSGTYNVIQNAAKELADEMNIIPFDSEAGSAALAFMCREARRMERAGASIQVILSRLEEIRRRVTIIFTVDSLDYAYLSGRINMFQSAISSLLKIKPLIILRNGLLVMADKVRTRQRSLDRVVSTVAEKVGNRRINLAVVHAADPETANRLVEKARKLMNIKEVITTELSIPVAANLGPKTVGLVAYPVEEDW